MFCCFAIIITLILLVISWCNSKLPEYFKSNNLKKSSKQLYTNVLNSPKWNQSNYKPNWSPSEWDDNNNCYSYAYNDNIKRDWAYQQPGTHGGGGKVKRDLYNCTRVEGKILLDDPLTHKVDCTQSTCKDGYHKIALAVDPSTDYHFYREDDDGTWSHKLGSSDPEQLGSEYPWTITRDYGDLNYTDFCGCYCVESDGNLASSLRYNKE